MLADQLDYVIGVDPHRDAHTIAVVNVRSGGVVFEAAVNADATGYEQALALAEQHAPGRRAFAVEGTASFGAGLTACSSSVASRYSRSVDSAANVAPAARPTRSTQSGRREACSLRTDLHSRAATANAKRCAR